MSGCIGRPDVPLVIILKGLKDMDSDVQRYAMMAYKGRKDTTFDTLKNLLYNQCDNTRLIVYKLCQENNIKLPLIRTIEPPTKVYKKCLDSVIVVAEIPQTAQVRGVFPGKCRANEAIITDVINGEVGISWYDGSTEYRVGDHIIIDKFDYSNEECSTGFHFFNTLKEAEKYSFA